MKIAVVYQSRGGNTRAVADVIAENLELKAASIDEPLNENVDVLFLGGGAYGWDADPQLKKYLETLDSHKIGQIIAFTTTGVMKVALNKITEYANKAGIKVCEKQLCIKMGLQGHSTFGREGGKLTDEQLTKIKNFTSEVLEGLKNGI